MPKVEIYGDKDRGFKGSVALYPNLDCDREPLLPCPFCGQKWHLEVSNTHTPICSVRCLTCEAEITGPYMAVNEDKDILEVQQRYIEAAQLAIEKWNNRQ